MFLKIEKMSDSLIWIKCEPELLEENNITSVITTVKYIMRGIDYGMNLDILMHIIYNNCRG